jgi:hypothetical protein
MKGICCRLHVAAELNQLVRVISEKFLKLKFIILCLSYSIII